METIQNFFEQMIKEENISTTISIFRFYKKCLEVFASSNRKSQPSQNKAAENSPTYYIFQHIADYLCPKNGCLSKVLTKY